MNWNYGLCHYERSTRRETFPTTCDLLTCTKTGGQAHRGDTYPYFYIDGYPYVVIINLKRKDAKIYHLDAFEDGTYQIVGADKFLERAVFREGVLKFANS